MDYFFNKDICNYKYQFFYTNIHDNVTIIRRCQKIDFGSY